MRNDMCPIAAKFARLSLGLLFGATVCMRFTRSDKAEGEWDAEPPMRGQGFSFPLHRESDLITSREVSC
jgi:hypothetical protein